MKPAKSGKYPIVPGKPGESEMIKRITHNDPDERMPYKHEALSKEEIKISETEFICLQQLRRLKETSEKRLLEKDEVAIIDLLHKNLLMARGIPVVKKNKEKKKTKAELLKILDN